MNDLKLDVDFLEFDAPDTKPDYGFMRGDMWVVGDAEVVDGVEWWPVAGGIGNEYIRFDEEDRANGNPHIVAVYGEDRYGNYLFSPEDINDYEDPKWVPCWPVVIKTFEYTEYDVDYGEAYDTFEEAVREGLKEADARRGVR